MITVGDIRRELAKYSDDCPLRFSIDSDDWSEPGLRLFCEDRIESCWETKQGPECDKPVEVTIQLVGYFNYSSTVCYVSANDA